MSRVPSEETKDLDDLIQRVPIQLPIGEDDRFTAEAKATRDYPDYVGECIRHGLVSIIDEAHLRSSKHNHPLTDPQRNPGSCSLPSWRCAGLPILLSTPKAILYALMDSSLAQKAELRHDERHEGREEDDQSVASYFRRGHEWATRAETQKFAPVIYVRQLVDDKGRGLNAQQSRLLIRALRGYVSGKNDRTSLMQLFKPSIMCFSITVDIKARYTLACYWSP